MTLLYRINALHKTLLINVCYQVFITGRLREILGALGLMYTLTTDS